MSITFYGRDYWKSLPIEVRSYSDNTPMVKTEQFDAIVENADTMLVQADSLTEFVASMFLADTITELSGYNSISNLVLPYIPGARQDRINPTGDVLNTLVSVGEMINLRGFDRVVVLDPHSEVSNSRIRNLVTYPLDLVLVEAIAQADYDGIIAPDKGASVRATEAAVLLYDRAYGVPWSPIKGEKVRDVTTGRLSGFDITVDAGKHYLIVDDICDGGGTFIGLNEKIREQGATADLYVSHGIFSKGTRELSENFDQIITTDSREFSTHWPTAVTVLPVVEKMVRFAQTGKY